MTASVAEIRSLGRQELAGLVDEQILTLGEAEAIAVLENRHCTPQICLLIAQSTRLAALYSIRLRLVAHRLTPQAWAMKFVPHLYWNDLLRLSTDVRIPGPIRRAIDGQLIIRMPKLSLGERISSAKLCSRDLIKSLIHDEEMRVFAALLNNPRLSEEDLAVLINSGRATVEQLTMIASSLKWVQRYVIRRSLVINPSTPRAIAASQLRFLTRDDLRAIYESPVTSVYLRRCIERMR